VKACPVCSKAGLADEEGKCPQCNADLECFDLLDSLHEEVATPQLRKPDSNESKALAEIRISLRSVHEALGNLQTNSWFRHYGLSVLLLLVLGALILFLYREFAMEQRLVDRISQLESLNRPLDAQRENRVRSELSASIEATTQRLAAMEQKLSDLSAKQNTVIGHFSASLEQLSRISERLVALEEKPSGLTAVGAPSTAANTGAIGTAREDMYIYHNPRKGETLWSIAKRYYDSGQFYPVLLEYNPGLGIYFDQSYGRIKVLKDRRLAKQVLAAVRVVRGNRILFRYKVMEGDTWERISERFFGHARNVGELMALNPGVGLVTGDRVLVPLP
jgi:LysM repeat protein